MKTLYILLLLAISINVYGQVPANDDPANALLLPNVSSNCSVNGAYSSIGATPTFADQNKDVWFKFTAVAFDISITVTGNGTSALMQPGIDIYSYNDTIKVFNSLFGSPAQGNSVTTYYKGGLTIGRTYYFRVYGLNGHTGTFQLCVNNYFPILKAGQDYGTASVLCSKASFTQTGVTGAGLNNREAAGTCLDYSSGSGSIEANTAWYKWTAANNGTLTFTITPTVLAPVPDDIDWVLYDLGPTGSANSVVSANAIRCDASRGVDCTGAYPNYYKTGLRDGENHTSEAAGCAVNFDGYDQTVTMIQGHVYGLLVNNFSNGNNGFTIDFGGTGQFVGPSAAFTVTGGVPCTAGQIFTFTNQSINYQTLKWSFGEGATPSTGTGNGPFFVTYSTVGVKTAVLQALGGQGCTVVADTTFTVGLKPPKPIIDTIKKSYCLLDTLILSTPVKANRTYQWTGPNNFTSADSIIKLPLRSYQMAGTYVLRVTEFGCTSDTASVTVVSIGKKPVLNFTVTPNNLCSTNQSFTITNQSVDYTSLVWDYGTGANTPTTLPNGDINVTYSSFGQKTITLTATGDKGCITVLSQNINVPAQPATPSISLNKSKFCAGDTIVLTTPTLANTSYMWSGPNNFSSTQQNISIIATDKSVAGTYSLIIVQSPCSSNAATIVIDTSQIVAIPVAAFSATPPVPSKLAIPATVQFTNTSTLADSYFWDFGDGGTSTLKNPSHQYTSKGDFSVSLTATSKGLCNNTIAKGKLILRYDVSVFIPNTFTPNSDGLNDSFVVKITNMQTYHIQIFNRYGKVIFESHTITDYWRGLFNNRAVPVGTYYYLIDGVTRNGDNLKESGYIALIR